MTPSVGSVRRQAQNLYRQYMAIIVLLHGGMRASEYGRMQASIQNMNGLAKHTAMARITEIEHLVDEMRAKYEITTDTVALTSFLIDVETAPAGQEAWVAKAKVITLARRYDLAFANNRECDLADVALGVGTATRGRG